IKCVQELLPRCCTGICSPMVQSTAKTSEVKKTFRRSVKRNTHTVQQVNDFRRRISHCFYRGLVCQEVTAVNRVVKMYSSCIGLTFCIDCSIYTALGTYRVGSFHRYD